MSRNSMRAEVSEPVLQWKWVGVEEGVGVGVRTMSRNSMRAEVSELVLQWKWAGAVVGVEEMGEEGAGTPVQVSRLQSTSRKRSPSEGEILLKVYPLRGQSNE